MLLMKRNILECLIIISCSGAIICILLNCATNISPITGAWFLAYIFIVFVISVSLSFKFLQWLLHLNKPIKYDLEGLVNDYPYLSCLIRLLPQPRKRSEQECKEYDTNELSIITTVLERKLVSSWYVQYISQEIGFPFACKQLLDQMIGKCFQICDKIETKDVYVDICAILISHLKEYRKAMKRHDKSPHGSIEAFYKKSHPVSNPDKNLTSSEHCTNVLRVVLKELVPWELWDTPQSELLVRILAKKFDSFIDNTLTNPAWLNEKLLTYLKMEEVKQADKKVDVDLNKENVKEAKEEIVVEKISDKPTVESALTTMITKTTAPILQRDIIEELIDDKKLDIDPINIIEEVPVRSTEPVDIKSSPVMRQRRGRQGRNEVKIYDRIIEGSVKTWETDIDLQCISLGQDLLASLDGEITLSRLWGQDAEPEGSPNPPRSKSPQPLWFGEEDAIDLELADTSPKEPSPVRKELSPKPTDALLKDLQTTVHQAKTKIGDLQVPPNVNIDVPRKQYSGDEAAGMMEGLLDFGIAGLKKGLRLTGLSDDSQDKSPSHTHKERIDRISPPEGRLRAAPAEARETLTSSLIQREDNGINSVPPLLKQHRVISQDSVPHQSTTGPMAAPGGPTGPITVPGGPTENMAVPTGTMAVPTGLMAVPEGPTGPTGPTGPIAVPRGPVVISGSDSPEPEYEEAADLSTSIAKLRCLLQRAETSPKAEEAWWESQRPHSSRPIDTATLADEYDMNAERNPSPGLTSNNMQRLDKLFQRTVTGVFNSIRTAVGAEGELAPRVVPDWTYVTTSIELSVCGAVGRLVGSRRALAHVDHALDSLTHLTHSAPVPPPPEDLEEWCVVAGVGYSAASELCAAAAHCSHLTHRLATVLLAELAESLITSWLDELSSWLRSQVFVMFERASEGGGNVMFGNPSPEPNLDDTCAAIIERLPKVMYIFGEETLQNSVRLSVHSLSHKALNKDLGFRLLDAFTVHFKHAADIRNPSFDAN